MSPTCQNFPQSTFLDAPITLKDGARLRHRQYTIENVFIGLASCSNSTVENNAYVCRIEIFPPKVNVKIQVSYTYDKLSIYIGHFML